MRVFLTGSGSAAKRHRMVLESMGYEFTDDVSQAAYAVIASLTPNHQGDIIDLYNLGFKGKCLVEKPLFMRAVDSFKPDFPVYVGYQLRFLPVVQALKKAIEGATIYSVSIYAGQHVSLWGGTYHADKSKGGGVLRDYSHEFDLIQWLFGVCRGETEGLVSTTQDNAMIVGIFGGVPVSLSLNYFDEISRREWIVNTDKGTFKIDLIANTLNGELIIGEDPTRLLHEAILNNDGKDVCTFDAGVSVNHLIDGIEA